MKLLLLSIATTVLAVILFLQLSFYERLIVVALAIALLILECLKDKNENYKINK